MGGINIKVIGFITQDANGEISTSDAVSQCTYGAQIGAQIKCIACWA